MTGSRNLFIPDFQLLFESSPNLYLILAPDLTIVAVTNAYLRATLTKREDILGRVVFDVFPDNPEDPQATGVRNLRASLQRVLQFKLADTMAVQKYDIRRPESQGGGFEERYWNPVNFPVLGPDGEVVYIIHGVEDVTEMVRLRQQGLDHQKVVEQLKLEERFRKAFNANPEPISIATIEEGRYIDVNESFLRVTGYRREEVIGRTSLELGFWERPEDRSKMVEALRRDRSVRDVEISFRTKSGERRDGLDSAEAIDVAGQQCVFAIFKDITDRKVLEKQLHQAQRMEAIGQLSGGIAHDFNNLLGVIIGYCEIMEDQLPPDSSLRRECGQIKKAGERAASLTRQLLAFSRQQVLEPKIIDLNAAVLDMEKMLRRLIGEDIELKTFLETSLGSVKADRGQIEQVIMNLVVNARDAMPDGGTITIETANAELDEGYIRRHVTQPAGEYVLLSVTDNGIGMDAETQARIFEPFFTTKELGKGTGLGLSTVYGVVKQSGGHIWVYSEPGYGTAFKIYLPRTDETARAEKASAAKARKAVGADTILLVEDEEPLRILTGRFLTDSGYTVLEAEHPAQAIQIAERHSGPIHLLLTDVVMPGMNGRMLAERMRQLRPQIKVLYMSGYTGFSHRDLLSGEVNILAKPFTRESLLAKLGDVLAVDQAVDSR